MKFEQNWLSGFRGGRLKMLTDGRTDARTDDGRKVITIAHPEHSSGELKKQEVHGPQFTHLIKNSYYIFENAMQLSSSIATATGTI